MSGPQRSKPILLGFLLLFLAACSTLEEKPAHLPFHVLYAPIESPAADHFVAAGVAYLEAEYGPLPYSVNEVLLRHSNKSELGRQYRLGQHFSKLELLDAASGRFVIYLAVTEEDPEFYPLLAHEIGHLLAPEKVDDWEMEGFCMVFSEELCAALGKDWTVWRERFTRDSKDPYAVAYWKAKDGEG